MRCAVPVVRIGERKGAYRILVGKPEGKRSFRRATSRWKKNIKIYIKEIGPNSMD
jgi:hypothetical protein